jgi:SAM-dependent methyltransferase
MAKVSTMITGYHDSRLPLDTRRSVVWKALWQFHFRHQISVENTVLDLGCGYGDFINNVQAKKRIALDLWPDFPKHIAQGVETIVAPATDLSSIADASVDYAFASNLFEHLTKAELELLLSSLRKKLSPGGSLNILQPNYRYCSSEYFDDYTHVSIWSHISLPDFLWAQGYRVTELQPRFLPLTVKSRFPVSTSLIGLYIKSPLKPFGKQMFLSACLR